MSKLTFNGNTFTLEKYESVLDCLLRNGQHLPYACKAGMCQACLIRAVDCEATPESKKWIKESLQQRGYTLACQWVPDTDVSAARPTVEEFSVPVRIRSMDFLNQRTIRLRLDVEDRAAMFHYLPGQYLTLINPTGIARSYSIANDFEIDEYLELHISHARDGLFTGWLFEQAQPGDRLHMRGPAGDCFYSNQAGDDFPILLAGTGTGLAPLYGIANDALKRGHQGPIRLYHGGRTGDHLYYTEALQALQDIFPQFHYVPCARETGGEKAIEAIRTGRLEDIILADLDANTLPSARVFLCGAPDFVHGMRKQVFLKGAKSSNIHCDPFLERSVAATGGTR